MTRITVTHVFFTMIVLLAAGAISLPVNSAELPPEFTAKYDIKKGFLKIGNASRSFKKTSNGKYTYTSDSKTSGFIAALFKEHIFQSTTFDFENNLIKPLTYDYSRNGGKKTVNQNYDWINQVVHSKRDNKLFEYEIPAKVQDQSIYQLSLMLDLADGKRNFTYHIAENVRMVDYSVKQINNKKLKTALGKLDTVVVRVENRKIKTTIWCARALNYLPVKIEHEEGGTTFTAHIKSVSGLPAARHN